MKKYQIIVLIVLLASACALIYANTKVDEQLAIVEQNPTCTPTFVDGGGPYYKPNSPFRAMLAPENHTGKEFTVSGFVVRNDCKTRVPDAVLDIWQANETGSYEDEWYRGQVRTDSEGRYTFTTVVPNGYGEGTGYRPPHIHFKIWIDTKEIITSQMFFPESRGKAGFDDAYIVKMVDATHATHTIVVP